MSRMKFCPRCEEPMSQQLGRNAISRRDNQTEICSGCGLDEALEDSRLIAQYKGKRYWRRVQNAPS